MPEKLRKGPREHREMEKKEIRCLEYPKSLILGIEKRKMDNSGAMKQKQSSHEAKRAGAKAPALNLCAYGAKFVKLHRQEELNKEDKGEYIGENGNFLSLSCEDFDDGVADKTEADAVSDGA